LQRFGQVQFRELRHVFGDDRVLLDDRIPLDGARFDQRLPVAGDDHLADHRTGGRLTGGLLRERSPWTGAGDHRRDGGQQKALEVRAHGPNWIVLRHGWSPDALVCTRRLKAACGDTRVTVPDLGPLRREFARWLRRSSGAP
jgi:hypothetical protein